MPLSLINPLTEASTIATNVVNNSAQTNYIAFPVATSDPTSNGWRVYADSAANLPVDGTGGSPNTTLTQNTSTPLSSTGDFRLTKNSGASRQGEGISTDFTIANRHLGKILQISFDYELVSGTLATDDLRIYIIQEPGVTNTVIEPVNVGIQGTVSGTRLRHLATFQTDISVTSYRLCIHIKTTTNSAQTIDFNNFRVWESVQSISSVITDWISYTPSTTRANTTNRSFYYRRSGGNIQISFGWQYTSGVSSSSTALLSDIFPPGLTLDLTRIAPANGSGSYLRYNIGHYFANDFGTSNNVGAITWDTNQDPDQIAFFGSAPNSADDNLSGMIECPITGWGSSVAMSSDSGDGRVVACKYTNAQIGTTNNPIIYDTRQFDTHNSYSISTGLYTVPISGIYRISASLNSNAQIFVQVYKNSNVDTVLDQVNTGPSGLMAGGSTLIQCVAGDTLSIRPNGASTASSSTFISIDRISAGSQVIATTETVACSVSKTSGTATTPNRIASWNTKDLDTHSSFDLTNGTFTVPMSGVYLINAAVQNLGNFTSYNQPGFTIRVGTTILSASTMYFTSSFEPELSTSALRRFVAGDIISLYGYGSGFSCNALIMNISRIGI